MKTIFLKKTDENRLDVLLVDMEIDIRKEYKNITRHSGRMVHIIDWRIALYINGNKLDEDEVFVEDEFLKSLICPGKYPMFTCTCGIFGCGGYYVEVSHEDDRLFWVTEQSPFQEQFVKTSNKFAFTWIQIIDFLEGLIHKFDGLKSIMNTHGLNFQYDVEKYRRVIKEIKERAH
ncbi:hypothetical protein LK13_04915 [Paenibacillus polymyxa]|uniref:hypothetical protein n=1 Tax=Paenibacillus polymyxa TaxID=1406 RepID=UPI00042EF828|nr:hypothetical protein [Paenibacillus polymyxa]AHM67180.1 hypothetical protein PPSQR21_035420 [Paenibacillus polymyxa SQR-21]AIY07976.1 hypothetical protein LK13_04915 [Paenibacillus polymyxa]RGL29247.1 hypothetical protein DXC69_25240 [Paenibacillus polymyxa]UMR34441.1 hypothetical protein MJ749_17360 [Paenibacillus polymyxa]